MVQNRCRRILSGKAGSKCDTGHAADRGYGMRKKSRKPFSWIVEEYAFGAVALRDEIKRHKEEDVPWSVGKAVGIRLLYIYALVATLVLVACGMMGNWLQDFRK